MKIGGIAVAAAHIGLAVAAAGIGTAGGAQTPTDPLDAASRAVEKAETARLEAQRALDEATAALREARAALDLARTGQSQPTPPPLPAAPTVLAANATPACAITPTDPAAVANDPNAFQGCIGLSRWRDFPASELNINLAAASDATVDFLPSYTRRYRSAFGQDDTAASARNWYWRVHGGVSIKLDKDKKSATFADLTKYELAYGIEYVAGFEFGFGRDRSRQDYVGDARKALQSARQACISFKMSDPLPSSTPSATVLPTSEQAAASCTGIGLTAWIAADPARRETYYKSIVKPQWGYDKADALYFGAEARLSEPKLSFFPFSDPAGTGTPLITALPSNFPQGAATATPTLFSATAYVGTVLENRVGLSASLSYGRRADFPAAFKDVSVCAPQQVTDPFLKCATINTAAPFISEGWTIGGRVALKIERIAFLPEMGLEAKLSHRFDIDQFGIQVPFRAFLDDKGKTSGGVLLGCTTDGETANGFKIDGDCRASLFVGRAFTLTGKP